MSEKQSSGEFTEAQALEYAKGSSGNKGSDCGAVSTTIEWRPSKAAAFGVVTNPRANLQKVGQASSA